jgi:hypothetical protein
MKALSVFIGLAIANYAYQFFGDNNLAEAFQRTWFQGTGLLSYYLLDTFVWRS